MTGERIMDKKINHLQMIQGVISRMASNSFALKGWAVTLVAGIFALASKDADTMYFLVTYIPVVVFWGLDAYYLQQERLYRALYDKVRTLSEDEIDFSMDTSPAEFHSEKTTYRNCLTSKTVLWFYFPLALITAGIIILTHL